jgi:hypothetical protein
MSGSVPDMSANWAAKVAVAAEQQADAAALGRVYELMTETFLNEGLNAPAIKAQRYASVLLGLPCGCRSLNNDPPALFNRHFNLLSNGLLQEGYHLLTMSQEACQSKNVDDMQAVLR